jgi:Xaa-Pro aminopeptidase
MHTMHPTLLVGPGDWDPQRLPRQDYEDRLVALWRDHPNAGGAIVYGNSHDYAALAYLTHFTPKLEAAIALMPRHGEPQMLVGGGINMLAAAKPLTFISQLAPLRDAAKPIADWARRLEPNSSLVLLGGDTMPYELRCALDRALGGIAPLENGDAALQARMRRKSTGELDILRSACTILGAAVAALRAAASKGQSVTDCILAAEHTALQSGAQDARSLFSLDGGKRLRPFDVPVVQCSDPLQVYLAVRRDGYWADAFVRAGTRNDKLGREARKILEAMLAEMKPGMPCRKLHQIAETARGKQALHPLANETFGSSIGLSLDESPLLTRDGDATLEAGALYSLRVGVMAEHGRGAVISAIALVTQREPEVLWPIGGLS